jgi:hypothetical protein
MRLPPSPAYPEISQRAWFDAYCRAASHGVMILHPRHTPLLVPRDPNREPRGRLKHGVEETSGSIAWL